MDIFADEQVNWLRDQAPRLVLYARHWVNCHADAEDVVQEAIMRFWRARERPRDRNAYLYVCVRRAALNWSRDRKRRAGRERQTALETWFEPTDDLLQSEQNAAVQQAMLALSPERREVVALRIWGELTFQQIGEALGISPSTADSRYRLALADLRLQLEEVV